MLQERHPLHPAVHVYNEENQCVFVSSDGHLAERRQPRRKGRYRNTCLIPPNFFAEGMFSIDVSIGTHDPVIVHVFERGLLAFHIHDPADGSTVRGLYAGPYPGVVRPDLRWTSEPMG